MNNTGKTPRERDERNHIPTPRRPQPGASWSYCRNRFHKEKSDIDIIHDSGGRIHGRLWRSGKQICMEWVDRRRGNARISRTEQKGSWQTQTNPFPNSFWSKRAEKQSGPGPGWEQRSITNRIRNWRRPNPCRVSYSLWISAKEVRRLRLRIERWQADPREDFCSCLLPG